MNRKDFVYDHASFGWLAGVLVTVGMYEFLNHPVLAVFCFVLCGVYMRWSIPDELAS